VSIDKTRQSDESRDPTVLLFWAFVALHVTAWTIVPALAQRCIPYDTVEMLYWGHEWQWGYFKHPPLPAWIAECCWLLFGSVDWPIYFVSQLSVGLCFVAAWLVAREVLSPWPALVSVMLLELCPFLNYTTPQWNNNGPTKPAWAFAILFLFLALTRRRWWCWPAAGVALGLAFLAKYDVALLVITMIGFLAFHPVGRSVRVAIGAIVMLLVAGLIATPHLVWLLDGDAPTLAYIRSRVPEVRTWQDHIIQPLFFLVSQLGAIVGIPLLVGTVFGWQWRMVTGDNRRRFATTYLAAMVLGPPLLAISASAFTGMRMIALWGSPMWTFFGVLLMVAFEPVGKPAQFQQLARRCVAWGALFLAAFGIAKAFHGELKGEPRRVHYPGRAVAAEIDRRWADVSQEPLTMIGGDAWLAGLAAFYHPNRPHVYPDLQAPWAPWTSDEQLRQSGGVLVWQEASPDTVQGWLDRFPEARIEPPIELPVPGVFRDLSVLMQMAVVPPHAEPTARLPEPQER
jgi:hypothetical protein